MPMKIDSGTTRSAAPVGSQRPSTGGGVHLPPDRQEELNMRRAVDALGKKTADGTISASEKTSFEKPSAKPVIDAHTDALHRALKDRMTYDDRSMSTDHAREVKELRDTKNAHHDVDSLTETAKTFEPGSDGRKLLDDQIASRKKAESAVVDTIKQKTQLIGALDGEKINLEASKPAIAKDDFQQLREKAQPYLDVFNKYDGQDYSPDLFGDDWDSVKGDYSFDQMVKQFRNKPEQLKVWANHQDNPESKAAVQELTKVVSQYEAARTSVEAADTRISEIGAEQERLHTSIADDRTALSTSTVTQLDKEIAAAGAPATPVRLPADRQEEIDQRKRQASEVHVPADRYEEIAQRKAEENRQQMSADRADEVFRRTHPSGAPAPTTSSSGDTSSSTDTHHTAGTTTATPAASKPTKSADDVVRSHNNLGANYTVQQGDSLWKIANEYSHSYGVNVSWRDLYESNKSVVGEPQKVNGQYYAMIHPGQVLTIPGISDKIDEEVANSINGSPR